MSSSLNWETRRHFHSPKNYNYALCIWKGQCDWNVRETKLKVNAFFPTLLKNNTAVKCIASADTYITQFPWQRIWVIGWEAFRRWTDSKNGKIVTYILENGRAWAKIDSVPKERQIYGDRRGLKSHMCVCLWLCVSVCFFSMFVSLAQNWVPYRTFPDAHTQ